MTRQNNENTRNEEALAAAVEQYGPPFAQWAEAVGAADAHMNDFRGSYLGSWASISAFGRQFAAELGLTEQLHIPEADKPYVAIDTDALVMDMLTRRELQTIEDGRGIVHVFLGPGTSPREEGDATA